MRTMRTTTSWTSNTTFMPGLCSVRVFCRIVKLRHRIRRGAYFERAARKSLMCEIDRHHSAFGGFLYSCAERQNQYAGISDGLCGCHIVLFWHAAWKIHSKIMRTEQRKKPWKQKLSGIYCVVLVQRFSLNASKNFAPTFPAWYATPEKIRIDFWPNSLKTVKKSRF